MESIVKSEKYPRTEAKGQAPTSGRMLHLGVLILALQGNYMQQMTSTAVFGRQRPLWGRGGIADDETQSVPVLRRQLVDAGVR